MGLVNFNEWRKENIPAKSKWGFGSALQETPAVAEKLDAGWEFDGHTEIAKIDMTVEQWRSIKGIGPKLAERLVENGPYKSLDDVKNVKGISTKIVEQIDLAVPSLTSSAAYSSSDDVLDVEGSLN